MRNATRLCAALPFFVAACAPKGETPTTDSAATAAVAAVDPAAVRQTIDQENMKYADALQRGDTAALLALYDDDGMVMMGGAPAWRGHSEIASKGAEMFQNVKFSDATFNTTNVDVGGDFAIETGTYELTTTPKGGKPVPDKGKYVTVWKRQADGSWKVYRDIATSDLAPKT